MEKGARKLAGRVSGRIFCYQPYLVSISGTYPTIRYSDLIIFRSAVPKSKLYSASKELHRPELLPGLQRPDPCRSSSPNYCIRQRLSRRRQLLIPS